MISRPRSEAAHHFDDVLNVRWRREAVADQLTPLVKIRRLPEILGMVFQRFPLHEQPVALRHLVGALQGHEFAAFGALENRRGLFHARFEFGFHAGLYVYLCNLKDHGVAPSRRGAALWSAHTKVKRGRSYSAAC